MTSRLLMPRLSGMATTARVVKWLCEEGQNIREGDELLRLATATADIHLPAPMSGVVKEILVDEGDSISEGDVLAVLE